MVKTVPSSSSRMLRPLEDPRANTKKQKPREASASMRSSSRHGAGLRQTIRQRQGHTVKCNAQAPTAPSNRLSAALAATKGLPVPPFSCQYRVREKCTHRNREDSEQQIRLMPIHSLNWQSLGDRRALSDESGGDQLHHNAPIARPSLD